eukprot:352210-Chlamydomonas_euryale.AAC.6
MSPDVVGDGADVYSAIVADASSKAAAKEMQLSAARRERKETENAHQVSILLASIWHREAKGRLVGASGAAGAVDALVFRQAG